MAPSELLRILTGVCERLEIPYLVTGSMATIAFGEPRLTNDIDVVADIPMSQVEEFCRAFPEPDYLCQLDAARDAVARHFQFNILHPSSGLKIDVMIPNDTEFNRSRLIRGVKVSISESCNANFASPEDVIIKKLEYYQEGRSDKHLRDIAGVVKIRGEHLDFAYIQTWADKLGLSDLWHKFLQSMPP
jgi:hypothetical protein